MAHGNGDEDFESSASNHLSGYYEMEGVFNQLFFYNKKTARYKIFMKGGGRLIPKMVPAFIGIDQVIK